MVLPMQLEKDPTVWQRFSTKDAYMRTLTCSGLMYEVSTSTVDANRQITMQSHRHKWVINSRVHLPQHTLTLL
jgi:hypothetical protein